MSTIRSSPGLPSVSKPLLSQQVLFYERVNPGEGVWNSKSIKLFGSQWSFRIITSSSGMDFRIKYEGPSNQFIIEEIILVIGKTAFSPYEIVAAESIVEIVREVTFKKYEARLIRDVCSMRKLESLINSDNILRFSIKFTTAKIENEVNVDVPKIQKLETRVAELTRERNTMHKSLHNLSVTESQVSILTSPDATLPEVTKAYEGFKQLSKSVVFQLLHNRKPVEFGSCLVSFIKQISNSVRSRREAKFQDISRALGISKDNEMVQQVVDEAFRTILKSTGHTNLYNVSDPDKIEIERLIDASELAQIEEERSNVMKFATFIWGVCSYMYGNRVLLISWQEIGTTIKFDRAKYQSITRRVRKGEDCFVVIPRLQRRPYSNVRNKSPSEFEALCLGLVCPLR